MYKRQVIYLTLKVVYLTAIILEHSSYLGVQLLSVLLHRYQDILDLILLITRLRFTLVLSGNSLMQVVDLVVVVLVV